VVTGPHDRIFYDRYVIEELSGRIPNVQKVEIPDAAHMLPVECGPEFSRTLLDFAKILNV
jgi:pimeloyl-ACP methyl ester carboxylesterase